MGLTISKKATPDAPVAKAKKPAKAKAMVASQPPSPYRNMGVIMGLDISTNAGIAVLDFRTGPGELRALTTMAFPKAAGRDDHHQFERWAQYEAAFDALITATMPQLAVVEGYGFASFSLSISVEIGTHFKRVLQRRGIPWVEIKPSALKKFCTGSGGAKKDNMMLEAYKRFGVDTKSNDECDAAVLAYVGATLLQLPIPKLPAVHLEPLKLLKVPVCN